MPYLYDYLNYREFLKDYFKEQKSNGVTRLTVLKQMNVSSTGFLSNVIAGRNNLTLAQIADLAGILRLSKHEAAYFQALVLFNQAKRLQEKNDFCERLSSLRKAKVKDVRADQLTLFSHWYYVVIRELLGIMEYRGDAKSLARLIEPAVTPQEVEKAVTVLERVGLIKKLPDSRYVQCDETITAAKEIKSLDIANFQLDTLLFAKRALETKNREQRDISTMTLTLAAESLEKVRAEIVKFRANLAMIAKNEEQPEQVFQCNIQIFPMSKKREL